MYSSIDLPFLYEDKQQHHEHAKWADAYDVGDHNGIITVHAKELSEALYGTLLTHCKQIVIIITHFQNMYTVFNSQNKYSGPCNLRPLKLGIPSILRLAFSDTSFSGLMGGLKGQGPLYFWGIFQKYNPS